MTYEIKSFDSELRICQEFGCCEYSGKCDHRTAHHCDKGGPFWCKLTGYWLLCIPLNRYERY